MYCIQLTQLFSHLWLQTQTPDSQLLPHYDHQNLLPLPWCSSRAHPHKFTGWLAKGLAECRVQYNQWNCRRQFTTACCLMEPPKLKPIPNQPLSNFSNCSFGQSSTLWVCRTVMVVCTCVCRDLVLKTDHIRIRELGHGSMLMSMMVICHQYNGEMLTKHIQMSIILLPQNKTFTTFNGQDSLIWYFILTSTDHNWSLGSNDQEGFSWL